MSDLVGVTLKERYFLREQVGSGGMAQVYLAWDKMRAVKMAVKVLRRDLAVSPQFFQMFTKEAELLRKLEHPNIVRLYEFDRDKDVNFIIMDWIDGQDLGAALRARQKPFTLDEISRILEAVCSALNFAHQNRVFHCDIKPSNVLLGERWYVDKRILLTDFGVARLASENMTGGTPLYMAPEQFAGRPVDGRTDLYSLGVTLFELLSGGVTPFSGEHPQSVTAGTTAKQRLSWEHLNLPVPSLRQYNKSVPEGVVTVVETALHKDPGMRYGSAMDMRAAFEHARSLPGQPSAPGRASPATVMMPQPPKILETEQPTRKQPPPEKDHQVKAPHLYGQRGERQGQRIVIPSGGLTLGRSRTNEVHISEPSVSRQHARVIVTRRGIYIRDEGSSAGTFVNGVRLQAGESVPLKSGDIVQLGYYQVFEFRQK